jgi:ANTAR domain
VLITPTWVRRGGRLPGIPSARWLIEQAKGMVMARERLDAQAAFERLRRAARSSSRRLAEVARDVTAGKPLPLANRPQPRPSPQKQADQWDPGNSS